MNTKLRECFDDMVVYKDLKKSNFFSSLDLPSFLRDWVLRKFEDENGLFEAKEVTEFVKTYFPGEEEWIKIKNRIIYENERVKLLTKVNVDIDIKTGDITFSLPNFGLSNNETIIEYRVWERYKDYGYSVGVYGLEVNNTGAYTVPMEGVNFYPDSSMKTAIAGSGSETE